MKRALLLFLILGHSLCAQSASENPKIPSVSNSSEVSSIKTVSPLMKHSVAPSYFPKVNVVSGEYSEDEEDLVVAGSEPLSFRRFYHHLSPPDLRYGGWYINPEASVIANFEWKHADRFASVGEENGSVLFCNEPKIVDLPDYLYRQYGQAGALCYSLNPGGTLGYTNASHDGILSAQTNPYNTLIAVWKSHPKKDRFAWMGFIQDGSGRIREFSSGLHDWHRKVSGKAGSQEFRFAPSCWTPYFLPVYKEILPNGNIIKYIYTRWRNDKYYPSPSLLLSIEAYNHDETFLMGKLDFEYDQYSWKYRVPMRHPDPRKDGLPGKYTENVSEVASFRIKASEGRKVSFVNTRRDKIDYPIFLYDVQKPDEHIKYIYQNGALSEVDRGNGRVFRTEYHPETHKVTAQYAPVGPNGEMEAVGRFLYHDKATIAYDAENNPTIYRFDDKKRIIVVEKYQQNQLHSLERSVWDEFGRLESTSLEDASHRTVQKTTFKYDSKGNVLERSFSGIGGESDTFFYTYCKEFEYLNLKGSENDGKKEIRFTYKPKTNLVTSELTCVGPEIQKRVFYTYDECAICIRKVQDDGKSVDEKDLKGVTYRRITCISPRYEQPCFGYPEMIEEKTLDQHGNEILLEKVAFTYHVSGKVKTEDHYDAHGAFRYSIENEYDEKDRLTKTTNALGHITTFEYDENNNVIASHGPKTEKRWEYDKANRPIMEKTEELTTLKKYDRLSRVIAEIDESQNITKYAYDVCGRVIEIVHPDGAVEKRTYDILGNLIREVDPNGYEIQREYNYRGKPLHIYYPDGSEEHFAYDAHGTLKEHIDKNGCQNLYTYDAFDHLVSVEVYAEGNLLKKTSSTYSPFCKLSDTDEHGVITTYTYDFAGRKISEKKGDREVSFFYDDLGRLSSTVSGDIVLIEEFDLLDRVIEKRTENLQGEVLFKEKTLYDENGNCTHKITCEGSTETKYNGRNLPVQIISPDGHITDISYSYDGAFTKVSLDPQGVQTIEMHDSRDRLSEVCVKNRKGDIIQHRELIYDGSGNRTQAIEHIHEGNVPTRIHIIRWEYGPCNRVERLLESDLKETRYLYDAKGRLHLLIKPDGVQLTHSYDHLGRLLRLVSSIGDVNYTYAYDKQDRIVSLNGLSRSYDIFGNLLEERLENHYSLNRSYDPEGRRQTLFLPSGSEVKYTYRSNYLYEVNFKDLTYTYRTRNLSSKPKEILFPKTLGSLHLSYDSCLRYQDFRSPYYSAMSHIYDSKGNLTSFVSVDPLGARDCEYVYDDLNQLISEKGHSYVYDSLYNRTFRDERRCLVNDLCQITHDGSKEYRYDANGNLISSGDTLFFYDSLNRLTKVQKEGKVYEYLYDGFNRRITKKTPNKTIHYLWDDKNEIGSSEGDLRILGEGLGAEIGAACFIILNKQIYIPIHDPRGSVVSLVDLKEKTHGTYRYSAFGEECIQKPLSPWRFLSKRIDEETGFSYFGRRYYSPQLGRWITPDPLGFEDGPNLYAYVQNNPLMALDFYGEWAFWSGLSQGARGTFNALFPAFSELTKLPSHAPMWQRAALSGLAALEVVTCAMPAAKVGLTLAERSIYQINSAAARKGVGFTADKTMEAVARRKVLEKSLTRAEHSLSRVEAGLERSASQTNKATRNRFTPDARATGAHSVFRRDPVTGKVTHYETYRPQTNHFDPKPWESMKRFDGAGKVHRNKILKQDIKTPHIHESNYPGEVRYPEFWELP